MHCRPTQQRVHDTSNTHSLTGINGSTRGDVWGLRLSSYSVVAKADVSLKIFKINAVQS